MISSFFVKNSLREDDDMRRAIKHPKVFNSKRFGTIKEILIS